MLCQFLLQKVLQQNELAMHKHVSPRFWASSPFRSPQCIRQSSLCYTRGSHYLPILYIVSVVCLCQPQSPSSSSSDFPLDIHMFVMSVSLSLLCKQDHLYHFSQSLEKILMMDFAINGYTTQLASECVCSGGYTNDREKGRVDLLPMDG